MAHKIHHFENFSVVNDSIRIEVDMKRLENNFNKAQYVLDSAIMTSMEPYMPRRDGQLIAVTKGMSAALAGSGKVVAAAPPYGRFLYEGKVMIGEKSRSPWAKKGEKKVVTGRNLTYSGGGQAHWFDKAKAADGDSWVNLVKKTAGGG
jgi:hypothetical protein